MSGFNPLIASLGTLSVFQGVAYALTGGQTRIANDSVLSYIGLRHVLGMPVPMLVMVSECGGIGSFG